FTELAKSEKTLAELRALLGLSKRRSTRDFFDALVVLGLLDLRDGHYANTSEADFFLDKNKSTYIGGILEMFNDRLYRFWGDFTEGLKTGKPQNEAKTGGEFFAALYADPQRLEKFMRAMAGISLFPARALARKFPWKNYRTFADIGCAQGILPAELVKAHSHLQGVGFDLPPVEPIFNRYIKEQGLDGPISFQAGNFFEDDLPGTDVIVFGRVLHDWSVEQRRRLLEKAFAALAEGGAVVVYDCIIDNDRRRNMFGLLSSLTMLIETPAGSDYTGPECVEWMREAGFRDMKTEPLAGAESMVCGFKP
ncbi:MAG: methyltransferase, partial [Nitrospinales bacterium]